MNLFDPLGLAPCDCGSNFQSDFKDKFKEVFEPTQDFFFDFPTNLSRTALGLVLGAGTATSNTFGTVGFGGLRTLASGGIPTLGGVSGTLGSIAINTALATAAVAASLEAGIAAGSAAQAGAFAATNELLRQFQGCK